MLKDSNQFIAIGSYGLPANAILDRNESTGKYTISEGTSEAEIFNVNTINPFPDPVFREITLMIDYSVNELEISDTIKKGRFIDTIIGIRPDPIVVEGEFLLSRVSLTPSFQPTAGSDTPFAIVGNTYQTIPNQEKFYLLDNVLGGLPVTNPILIEDLAVFVQINHPALQQLKIRLLSPTENTKDPNAGVLLFDGMAKNAPIIDQNTIAWPKAYADAALVLYPQAGPTMLDRYKGQRADQGDGVWKLGVTDQVNDDKKGRLEKWSISFWGSEAYFLNGKVVDSNQSPIPGTFISLIGAETIFSAITDKNGVFTLQTIPPQRYQINVAKPGYIGQTRQVDLLSDMVLKDAFVLVQDTNKIIVDATLEAYVNQIENNPVTDTKNAIRLEGWVFAGGGVVPFDFYPPGSDLNGPPLPFRPVGENNPATNDFNYRSNTTANPKGNHQIRLGEDMAMSTTVDLNRPDTPPGQWNAATDPWKTNNPDLYGIDINVAYLLTSNPKDAKDEFSPNDGVSYDLLPGDSDGVPNYTQPEIDDGRNRCFHLTSCLGSMFSGFSYGGNFAISSGGRLDWLNSW